MALIKREYKDQETVITAENLNDIQDAIIALEDGLFSIDNGKSGEVITITDAAKRGFRSLNIYGKTTQTGIPTPDAPVDLVSVGNGGSIDVAVAGKNLLYVTGLPSDINGVAVTIGNEGLIFVNGTASAGGGRLNGTCYITLPPGAYSMRLYNAEKEPLTQIAGGVHISDRYTQAIIAKDNADFTITETKSCIVGIHTVDGQSYNQSGYVMITAATDATEYEPYKIPQTLKVTTPNGLPGIPVTSGGNYTDANGQQWVCDEIDFARGVYIQRIWKYICTGTEAWETSNIQSPNLSPAGLIRYDAIPYPYQPKAGLPNVLSEHCLFAGANMYNKDSVMSVWVNNDTDYLSIRIAADFETPEALKNWLVEQYSVGTPLTMMYVLKTPIETPLSEEELAAYAALHTYKEHTTVFNDAGAYMDLEYAMDAKKYIDSLAFGTMHQATVE